MLSNTDDVLSKYQNQDCMRGQHDGEDNIFVDSDDGYICGDVREY